MQVSWDGYAQVAAARAAVAADTAASLPAFVGVNGALRGQMNALEPGDVAPTAAMQAWYAATCKDLATAVTTWTGINGTTLATFNAVLAQNHLKPVPAVVLKAPSC